MVTRPRNADVAGQDGATIEALQADLEAEEPAEEDAATGHEKSAAHDGDKDGHHKSAAHDGDRDGDRWDRDGKRGKHGERG